MKIKVKKSYLKEIQHAIAHVMGTTHETSLINVSVKFPVFRVLSYKLPTAPLTEGVIPPPSERLNLEESIAETRWHRAIKCNICGRIDLERGWLELYESIERQELTARDIEETSS